MIAFGRRTVPIYRELIESYGLATRLAGIRVLDVTARAALSDPAGAMRGCLVPARELIELEVVEVLILAGATQAGGYRELQPELPVPLLDGIACGILQAQTLANLKLRKAAGSYAPGSSVRIQGVDPALAALIEQGDTIQD